MPWTSEAPRGGFSTVEPWLPMYPDHLGRSVAAQTSDPDSVLGFYRRFLAWRKGFESLRRGSIRFQHAAEPLLAFRREAGDERILAAFNLSPEPVRHAVPGSVQPLEGHGLPTCRLEGRDLLLPPWGGFFGRLA